MAELVPASPKQRLHTLSDRGAAVRRPARGKVTQMAISQDEDAAAPSTDTKPSNTQRSAEIAPFRTANIRATQGLTGSAHADQPLALHNSTEKAYAERLQAREFSIFDVFMLGMLAGGLLVYIALSPYARDRYVATPQALEGIRDRSPAAMQFDLERPWPSREGGAP